MGFPNPKSMSDNELLEALETVKRIVPEIMADDDVSTYYKQKLEQYVKDLLKEYEYRRNETWMFPLSAFGIVDF